MKTDFREVEIGGIYFGGELIVKADDDITVREVYVSRPQGAAIRKEEINVTDWNYKNMHLIEALIEALEPQIEAMLEELEDPEEEEDE